MDRDRSARQSLGSLHQTIKESRVLMVGAGGIGCELLKNLVLTGFGEIHIVDLDTIDVSNLNRQFLFRQEHVKKSKAFVAKEAAGRFNPNVTIEAYHANIKDAQFNIDWFSSFKLVFNALDNLEARRHVNKMCLAANVPLIESGTTGFKGQIQVIIKGLTECYDCNPKETPKTFPVCTIRSTPSQPIHCIVWAKSYLFNELFGASDESTFDHSEDAENAEEIAKLQLEAQALKRIRESMGTPDFGKAVFQKVFTEDIDRLRGMSDMWKSRKPPTTLNFEDLQAGDGKALAAQDQKTWTTAENLAVFLDSLDRLSSRMLEAKKLAQSGDQEPELSFDKDDVDTLDFVAAAANLRSINFDIPTKSKFDIKQMAGNIIPAIATTNAIVAGLCVTEAFKVLRGDYKVLHHTYLSRSDDHFFAIEKLSPPNPDCPICGVAQSRLVVDTSKATLNDLVEKVLKLGLGYGEEFSISTDVGLIYDPDLDDNLGKRFTDLGIKGDSFLTVVDEEEDEPRINLVLSITDKSLPETDGPIVTPENLTIARRRRPDTQSTNGVNTPSQLTQQVTLTNGLKRKRMNSLSGIGPDEVVKKLKPSVADEVIVLDDDDPAGGVIDLDSD